MMEWRENALCKNMPTEIFFDAWYDLMREEKDEIIQMCGVCPVAEQCYAYAVTTKSHGVWAGKDFRDGKPFSPYSSKRKTAGTRKQKEMA